jgi:hypothetical protein
MARSKDTEVIDILADAGVTELTVPNTETKYSHSFLLQKNRSFALEVQFDVTSGAVDVKIEAEVSGAEPATEGAADTNFVVPRAIGGGTNTDALVDSGANTELVRFYPFAPVVAPYQRFKFTGQGSNAASCKVTRLRVHMIESL